MHVGVIGLGLMGDSIAQNLLDRGYKVSGYDIKTERMISLAKKGLIPASSPAEIAKEADALILMVFNADQIRDVLFGENGAAPFLKKGAVVLITASVGYKICEEVSKKLEMTGVKLIDSPVRASFQTARNGTMYIMVAADEQSYNDAKPLLEDMGSEIVYVGKNPGMAQKAKSCMQAFFSLTFEATYEVLAFGTAVGLSPRLVFDILDKTGASNSIFRNTAKNIANGRFNGTANPLSVLEKDMRIVCDNAQEYNLDLPALKGVRDNFTKSMLKFPEEDVWAAIKTFEESAGIEVRFNFPEDMNI